MTGEKHLDPLARIAAVLDTYGANEARWPAELKDWMRAAIDRDPEAHALFEAAAELDDLLDTVEAPAPSIELESAILGASAPTRRRRWQVSLWPFGPLWQPASALATALALGMLLGGIQLVPSGDELSELAEVGESLELAVDFPEIER